MQRAPIRRSSIRSSPVAPRTPRPPERSPGCIPNALSRHPLGYDACVETAREVLLARRGDLDVRQCLFERFRPDMDVIITESSGPFRRWATQFVAAQPEQRDLVVFRARGRAEPVRRQAREIYQQAAERAGRRGSIIVSVGHGGTGSAEGVVANTTVGMVDLAPAGRLRLQREHVFYREQRGHDERTLTEVRNIGERRCRGLRRIGANRVRDEDAMARAYCQGASGAGERLSVRSAFDDIGRQFQRTGLGSVVLLTCRVGGATAFVDRIASDWGVRVIAFQRRVAGGRDSDGSSWADFGDSQLATGEIANANRDSRYAFVGDAVDAWFSQTPEPFRGRAPSSTHGTEVSSSRRVRGDEAISVCETATPAAAPHRAA